MNSLIPARVAMPGAGTCLGALAGAMEVLSNTFAFQGFGGTSGGGLVALALASGMKPTDVSKMCSSILLRKDLLDWQLQIPLIGSKTGVYKGAKIDSLLQDIFGQKRLGDLPSPARVCVSSMWTKRAAILCSKAHPDVLAWRAARATMNIEEMFELVRVREDNARTYGDGGAGLNVPAGLWDDDPGVTVSLRFSRQEPAYELADLIMNANGDAHADEVVPVRNEADVAAATFDILMDSSCAALPCRKPAGRLLEVVVDCDGDSLKFGLAPGEVQGRRDSGIRSALAALAKNQPQILAMPRA